MAKVISGCRVFILVLISIFYFYLAYGHSGKAVWTDSEGTLSSTINYITESETTNESTTNTKYIPNMQNISCETYENGYCVDSTDYPMDHIQEKLSPDCHFYRNFFSRSKIKKKLGTPIYMATSASLPTTTRIVPTSISTVDSEPIFFSHEEPFCKSHKRLKFMKVGRNVEKDWRFIVNQENFTQAVKTEECMGIGQSCAMSESLPLGYTTECKQEYSSRILLAVHPNGEILPDLFPLPSCCKCFLRRSIFF